VDPGTPVLVGIDGVPVPTPFAGGGVVPGGNEPPNVGLVVDPGTPVLVGNEGVPVPVLPFAGGGVVPGGNVPVAGGGVVPGGNVSIPPFAGGGVDPGGNEAPNVGLVVDPGIPVLVGIDGAIVPIPSPPVGDAVAAVGIVGEPDAPTVVARTVGLDVDVMSVSAVVGSELESAGLAVKELPDVVGTRESGSVGLPVDVTSSKVGDDVGEISTRLVQYNLSNTGATFSLPPDGTFK
jgi:hypothetical protein